MTPVRTISVCLIKPVPNTIAFGGVATGSIKAQDAPIPIISTKTSLGIPICSAIAANTGTKSAADAVFDANSVKKIMKAEIASITTNSGAVCKPLATVSPSTIKSTQQVHKKICNSRGNTQKAEVLCFC